jgi:hypothetical protein
VIYYLKKIEQTYLDFKLMEAQLDQPGNIPWPRFHPLVQSVPELLNTDPFKYSRDLPPLLQELPTAPHAHESPEPPHKRLRITPSPTPPAGLQPAPRPNPRAHKHKPQSQTTGISSGPRARVSHGPHTQRTRQKDFPPPDRTRPHLQGLCTFPRSRAMHRSPVHKRPYRYVIA